MSKLLVVWFALGCLLQPSAAFAGDEASLAVMEFVSKGGVSKKQMDSLSDLLANEIRGLGNYRVIGKEDIRAALDIESQKNLLGCTDVSCVAEIGGALGVRWVVVGNVGQFGETFLLNLKLMDVVTVQVAMGVSRKVEGGESKLIDALSSAARELMAGAVEKAPQLPPLTVVKKGPKGPNTWAHVTFWSGTGLIVVGAIAAGVASSKGKDYSNEDLETRDRLTAADDSRFATGVMWLSFGAGVGLMTTGALLWLLDDPGTTASAVPTPDGQGMVFTVGGRW